MEFKKELEIMLEAAKAASLNIMEYYKKGFHVEIKDDNSPVTEADKTTDKLIREKLGKAFPTYAFLTEESLDDKSRLNNDYVFIVDPVDGTEDFVHHYDEFTCNIALQSIFKQGRGLVELFPRVDPDLVQTNFTSINSLDIFDRRLDLLEMPNPINLAYFK